MQLPTLPKAATKRKFEAPEPPVFGDVTLKSSSVTIEDAAEGDDDDDNRERMEAFAPGTSPPSAPPSLDVAHILVTTPQVMMPITSGKKMLMVDSSAED
jgi:hypothetical protein